MISLRLFSGFSVGTMPASANSGRVPARLRPWRRAMVSMAFSLVGPGLARHAANLGTQQLELLFDALVAAVDVVDAVDQRIAVGNQRRQHQAGRGAQVGGHDRRTLETIHPGDDGG